MRGQAPLIFSPKAYRRPNGWQRASRVKLFDPYSEDMVELPEWEVMLERVGVAEAGVVGVIKSGSEQGRWIRNWVNQHHTRRFVPERILRMMGLGDM
jgi:hypothetical protein